MTETASLQRGENQLELHAEYIIAVLNSTQIIDSCEVP